MRFPQLPIGSRFRLDGKTFTKDGPMTGTTENGERRLIPRSQAIEPVVDEAASTPEPTDDQTAAVDALRRELSAAFSTLSPAEAERLGKVLDQACARLLRTIDR